MKISIVLIFLLLLSFDIYATAQIPDKIIYNGKEYFLHSNPMEEFFAKYPDKKPKSGIVSTALWRGYVATFEVKDNQLFLKDIKIQIRDTTNKEHFSTRWKSVLNEIFPEAKLIKIDWFTGLLVIPHGKLVCYVHMGYASTYEEYILLEIENGNLKKEKQFNHTEYEKFKERQFEAFKNTDEYKKIKAELLNKEGYTDDFVDSFLKNYIINYTSKILVE